MSKEEIKLALEALAVKFSEGWHEGIKIDASDIMLLNDAAQAMAEQPAQQEPVAWMSPHGGFLSANYINNFASGLDKEIHNIPLYTSPPAQQEPVLQDIEQYRLQMAGICTAAIGYWKEGDGIHPDYDTIALRDVAKLYAKYDELYRALARDREQPAQQEPVAFLVDGDLYYPEEIDWETLQEQGHTVASLYTQAQRTWVGLTDEEVEKLITDAGFTRSDLLMMGACIDQIARLVEAKLKEKNNG